VYVGILLLAWVYAPAARRWVWVLGALPFVVLVARLYQGAHHLTDVLTSLTYASVCLGVLYVLVRRGHGPDNSA
jgi:undecaprenyl-diphosphatase